MDNNKLNSLYLEYAIKTLFGQSKIDFDFRGVDQAFLAQMVLMDLRKCHKP